MDGAHIQRASSPKTEKPPGRSPAAFLFAPCIYSRDQLSKQPATKSLLSSTSVHLKTHQAGTTTQQEEPNFIRPEEIREVREGYVRFLKLVDSADSQASVLIAGTAPKLEESNEPGRLRKIESFDEACLEGQRIALEAKRIFSERVRSGA